MKFVKKLIYNITYYICSKLVNLFPLFFLNCLRNNNLDCIIFSLNRPDIFNWKYTDIPNKVNGFEDLSFLFWTSPLNRGIIRQDLDEAALLFKTVKNICNPKGIEIGRYTGGSTILLAAAVGPKGKLISIDINPQDDTTLTDILNRLEINDRVELIVGNAKDLNPDDNYDFIFIDGDHTYEGAKSDHNKWGEVVKVGGYIVHHDMGNKRKYSTQLKSLSKLRLDILRGQQKCLKLVDESGSITVFQRISAGWNKI
jgi:hypothetical protein